MSKNPPVVHLSKRDAIKPVVLELSEALAKHSTIDKKTGKITAAEDAYFKVLPDDIPRELAVKLHKHNEALFAAGFLVADKLGRPVLEKDPNLAEVDFTLPMIGKDTVAWNIQREKVVKNSFAKEGEPTERTKHGTLSFELNMYGAEMGKGHLKHVKDAIAEDWHAAFAKA